MITTMKEAKAANGFLKPLANSYRLRIVSLLLKGEMKVSEINKHIPVSQPALSQHLAKLRVAGILGSRREQREIFYFVVHPQALRVLDIAAQATKKVA